MKKDTYVDLEKNKDFKKDYLNKTQWWKNILFVAPICFLFLGLVGILYLFHHDMLISIYTIPYLVFFVIGTIWLKAMKKYIVKTSIAGENSFLVCIAKLIGEKDGYIYTVFVNNENRHSEQYISNLSKTLLSNNLLNNKEARKVSIRLYAENEKCNYFLRAYSVGYLNKRNAAWETDNFIPVLYINKKDTMVIKKIDLI